MIKKIILTLLTASIAFAASDSEVSDFITDLVKKNPMLTPKSVKILGREKLPKYDNWEAVKVVIEYTANDPKRGKFDVKQSDMFFTKDNLITNELADAKNGKNLKDVLKPKLTANYYNDEHFVVGNKNSKYKIVIFSDPLCPVCKDAVPDILKSVIKNPTKAAVWHYSYPLAIIHPASPIIVKAELVLAKKVPLREILDKFYGFDINPEEKNPTVILNEIAKQLKFRVTEDEINSKEITKKYETELNNAYNMLIKATPSVYINGEYDLNRVKTTEIMRDIER